MLLRTQMILSVTLIKTLQLSKDQLKTSPATVVRSKRPTVRPVPLYIMI